ncbi:class II aldolase/adducin family protein, partial [bacterium]|nr:class II aldolase/adducin family protein [bacterium]
MIQEAINNIIEYGKLAGKKNLTSGNSGNISCRVSDKIVITATGTANGYLTPEDLTIIDFEGNIIEGKKPSSEKFLHIEFYRQREDINSIFHVHSPYLTAFAAAGQALEEKILPEVVFTLGEIPVAEYAIPGSMDLVEATSKFFKDYDVILMKNHGVIVGGKNIKDAYLKLELCETYAKTILFSKLLGGARMLPENEVEKIYS